MNKHSEDMRGFMRGYGFTSARLTSAPVGPRPDWMGPVVQPVPVQPVWREAQVGDSQVRICRIGNRYYAIELVAGPWPEMGALCHECDGGATFGGHLVASDATHAMLEVYI